MGHTHTHTHRIFQGRAETNLVFSSRRVGSLRKDHWGDLWKSQQPELGEAGQELVDHAASYEEHTCWYNVQTRKNYGKISQKDLSFFENYCNNPDTNLTV